MRTIQLRHTGIFLLSILQFAFAGISRGQNISVTPQLIPYPNQGVGTTSGGYCVTLLNNQTGPLSISNIQITAPFSQMNNCGTSLCAQSAMYIQCEVQPHGTTVLHRHFDDHGFGE